MRCDMVMENCCKRPDSVVYRFYSSIPLCRSSENIGTHFFATAVEKKVQQTVAAVMTTCNFTFPSHPPLSRKPRLSIYTGNVLVTSSTLMLRTLKSGVAILGNHILRTPNVDQNFSAKENHGLRTFKTFVQLGFDRYHHSVRDHF
ncbi:hypothetical protein TNCV_832411 [Trichonephila clavipes]|nr:hypothetical protein TNCV_832411 [Trichonephila clavipes]